MVSVSERLTPNRHRRPKERKFRRYVWGGVGLTAIAGSAWFGPLIADAAWHAETNQEQGISEGLTYAGLGDISVRCLSDDDFQERLDRLRRSKDETFRKEVRGFAVPYVPQIWLRQDMCDSLTSYMSTDPKPGTAEQFLAASTAVHEAEHIDGTLNEPEAECHTVQRSIYAATAMRRSNSTADAKRLLEERYAWRVQNPEKVRPGYALKDCYKGGPYDLGLDAQGVTVLFPPDALSRPTR